MKLTPNERRALAEFKKPKVNWDKVHGHTLHALERKQLVESRSPKPGWRLTAAGRAELTVPNSLNDLFKKKETHMMTNAEIDGHPLLDRDQQKVCKSLNNLAKRENRPFTMLEFAEIALRATGNDYAATSSEDDAAACDLAHRRAAILYVYEAIKAGPPIISETIVERGTLRDLELLARHL
jgi:hypothetical protein